VIWNVVASSSGESFRESFSWAERGVVELKNTTEKRRKKQGKKKDALNLHGNPLVIIIPPGDRFAGKRALQIVNRGRDVVMIVHSSFTLPIILACAAAECRIEPDPISNYNLLVNNYQAIINPDY